VLAGAVETTFLSENGDVIASATLTAGDNLTFEPDTDTFFALPGSDSLTEVTLIGSGGEQATARFTAGSELAFDAESFTFTAPADNPEPVAIVFAGGAVVSVDPGQTITTPKLIEIDIRPGDEANSLNLASNGKIAVAVLSNDTFDARDVIASTVVFAGASMTQASLADTNGDGRLDLVLHFNTQETNLRAVYEELLASDETLSSHQLASVSLTGRLNADGVDELFAGAEEMDLFLAGRALRELLEDLAAAGAI
jgi:hypothetical protein